ncbi:MAG TPA: sigma-70 family RNA polymerase sigma factor [Blastocatellia bacterium]|nr:sigma-70 family RNA polymerase sigma factor [Blastocatellia bacterium]
MQSKNRRERFEEHVLPHLDAAYNLARWLTRNDHDAQDIVQESYLRAFKFFDSFRSANARPWLLKIVRNTAYTWLQRNRAHDLAASVDDDFEIEGIESREPSPESQLLSNYEADRLKQALEDLPVEFREVMVMRELEELSYKEIADISAIPVGTVMSRLARARKRLQRSLSEQPARSIE